MRTIKSTKTALAKKLGVARSSLYYKPKKPPADEALKAKITAVMAEHPAYGHRRVALALHMNKKLVRRIMCLHGLKPTLRRRSHPVKPDDQNRSETQATNVLKRLCPIRPNVVWAGDFTYLWWLGRFWYVATVIDVYTRELVGWQIANHHTTALISEAFKDAVRRSGKTPQWFHSDQGSEYVSGVYSLLLEAYDVIPSHSKKASPWQNGYQESFYSNFKLELGNPQRFNHMGELIEAVHQQMAYYNTRRIHTSLRMSPLEFKHKYIQKQVAHATTTRI